VTRVLVVGGGIGGLTVTRGLTRAGVDAVAFERAPALEQIQVGGAIHIWHNGMRGLQQLGLADEVAALGGKAAVVELAEMRSRRGRLITSWSVKEVEHQVGAPTVGVLRPQLHRVLAVGVEEGRLQLGRELTGFEHDADGVTARFADGTEERGDVLVSADGLRSAVRQQLKGEEALHFAGYTSWQGVAQHRDEQTPPGLFRVVWGPGSRFLFYRISEEDVYWEGIFTTEPDGSDPPGGRKQAVSQRFGDWYKPVGSIIEATAEEAITRGDVYVRPPIKQWGEGRVTLLGDAAHPMTNAIGQGANQTIEDAVVLARCVAGGGDPAAALREYERLRIDRTLKIARLAGRLSRLTRIENPVATAVRDRLLSVMFAVAGKRALRKDMAHEF
jgi:2-polyprenyl-6-methoxyphenol hydroxylase-like FAD-dependent oxidoreductase